MYSNNGSTATAWKWPEGGAVEFTQEWNPPRSHLYLSVLMVNHDIVRLDISVHDPHAMTVIQGLKKTHGKGKVISSTGEQSHFAPTLTKVEAHHETFLEIPAQGPTLGMEGLRLKVTLVNSTDAWPKPSLKFMQITEMFEAQLFVQAQCLTVSARTPVLPHSRLDHYHKPILFRTSCAKQNKPL